MNIQAMMKQAQKLQKDMMDAMWCLLNEETKRHNMVKD